MSWLGRPRGDDVVRPFGAALPRTTGEPAISPWTPKPASAAPAVDTAARDAELADARAAAVAEGRAQGLEETEALRERLRALVAAFEAGAGARAAADAERIAGAACTVIEAWLGAALTGADKFAPIVRGWLEHAGEGHATATVNPADAGALKAAIGDAKIAVATDPKLAVGDIRIAGATQELVHAWDDRLVQLRDAIATSLVHGLQSDKA
jgi:flagellar biosynthesis/type III secretory pathway protein FliH